MTSPNVTTKSLSKKITSLSKPNTRIGVGVAPVKM
jgi:hypothetical protein